MLTIKDNLNLALDALHNERTALLDALRLAAQTGYDQPWLNAIDKALLMSHDASLLVGNVLATIRHPSQPAYGLKPGIIQPKRP